VRFAASTSNAIIGLPASLQRVGADEDDFHTFKRVSTQLTSEEKAEKRKSEIVERREAAIAAKMNVSSSTIPRSSGPLKKKARVVAF